MAPARYEIKLGVHLERGRWSQWFGGMTVRPLDDGTTVLSGDVADQAALHGLLAKVRDLGLPLIALHRVDAGPGTEQR